MTNNFCQQFNNLIQDLKRYKVIFNLKLAEEVKKTKGEYDRVGLVAGRDKIKGRFSEIKQLIAAQELKKQPIKHELILLGARTDERISINKSTLHNQKLGEQLESFLREVENLSEEANEKWPPEQFDKYFNTMLTKLLVKEKWLFRKYDKLLKRIIP